MLIALRGGRRRRGRWWWSEPSLSRTNNSDNNENDDGVGVPRFFWRFFFFRGRNELKKAFSRIKKEAMRCSWCWWSGKYDKPDPSLACLRFRVSIKNNKPREIPLSHSLACFSATTLTWTKGDGHSFIQTRNGQTQKFKNKQLQMKGALFVFFFFHHLDCQLIFFSWLRGKDLREQQNEEQI